MLQQHLPFTVLKLIAAAFDTIFCLFVATALTVYGIETFQMREVQFDDTWGCNSTYRLRY